MSPAARSSRSRLTSCEPDRRVYGSHRPLASRAYLGEDQVRLLHDELFQQATRLRRLADQLLDHSRLDAVALQVASASMRKTGSTAC